MRLHIYDDLSILEEVQFTKMNEDLNEVLDWIDGKRQRVARFIPLASPDPWTLHGEENVCVGCIAIFTNQYMADVPTVVVADEIFERKNENRI